MASAFHQHCQPDAFLDIGHSYHRQNRHHVLFHHRDMVGFNFVDDQLDVIRGLDVQGLENANRIFAHPVAVEISFRGGEQAGQAVDIPALFHDVSRLLREFGHELIGHRLYYHHFFLADAVQVVVKAGSHHNVAGRLDYVGSLIHQRRRVPGSGADGLFT